MDIGNRIIRFILQYKKEHGGNSPSVQDVADNFGMAKSAAYYRLKQLEGTGAISREPGISRSIVVNVNAVEE